MNNIYSKYVGIPFENNGRDTTGYDCWGLVKQLYKDFHGEDIPDFIYNKAEASSIGVFFTNELFLKNSWEESAPREGTIAVFRIGGVIRHVGFMINSTQFIHTIKGCATSIESIKSLRWANRFEGCYTWQQL